MSAQKPEKIEKPEEIIRAEQLSDEGKLDEAVTLLNNYEQKEGLTHHDKASCHLLQCQILFWQGKYKELIKHAEQTYKESKELENKFLRVDSLFLMVYALIILRKFDEASDVITQGEELLKILPQELTTAYKQRKANLAFLNGYFYTYHFFTNPINPSDINLSLKHLEQSLALREELGIKHEISESLCWMAQSLCFLKGDLDRALKYAKRSLTIAKESSNKYYIAESLLTVAIIYMGQGELEHSIRLYEQSLELFKELNNKWQIAEVFYNLTIYYKRMGNLDQALECIEQAMTLSREFGYLIQLADNLDIFFQVLVDKGDFKRAQISLQDLEQLSSQLKIKRIDLLYLLDKALLLKTSLRARDRGKAEEVLTQLLEEEDFYYEDRYRALLILCELLLTELRITNDSGVLDELNQFISQLLEIAEKSHSYWILCETYIIQAKVSLLTFDIKSAKRLLIQAHQIAERFDLTQLTAKIANEKEDLDKKLDLWEKLKEEDAPMSDRMELARLDEKIVKMIQKHPVLTVQVSEEKIAISKEKKICLVCRGEVFGFSYACKCGANYCENCARALSNLENVCWACETPIDYSKPVNPFKEEEERIKVQEKAKKK